MALTRPNRFQYQVALLFVLSLGLCVLLYQQGLDSDFILDDEPNLQYLTTIQNNPGWQATLHFISQGTAGIIGRPISLASFAFQFYAWPSDAATFKHVNLMIHLLTGCALFIFLTQLSRFIESKTPFLNYLPIVVTIIWLIHPIQTSTVLYVVQRMAQLSTLFTLVGLIFYLKGRWLVFNEEKTRGYFYALFGLLAGGGLAVLSKENGALLIFYILLLEITVLRHIPRTKSWNLLLLIFVILPMVLGFVYLALRYDRMITAVYAEKPFSLGERLLTEARVLWQYLANIFLIKPNAYGVFHDDFTVSKSLFAPMTTLYSLIGLLGILWLAFKLRKSHAVVSFGILWYFVSHGLESTIFPLELYFEHRNYLALMGPLVVFVLLLNHLYHYVKEPVLRYTVPLIFMAWIGFVGLISKQEADLWHQSEMRASLQAQVHPGSIRAQLNAISYAIVKYDYVRVHSLLKNIVARHPRNTALLMNMVSFHCLNPALTPYSFAELVNRLKQANTNAGYIHTTGRLVQLKENKKCNHLSYQQLDQIFVTLAQNPNLQPKRHYVYLLHGRIKLNQGHYVSALNLFEKSYALVPDIASALYLTQTCELLRHRACALRALRKAYNVSQKRFWDRINYTDTLDKIRTRINQTLK